MVISYCFLVLPVLFAGYYFLDRNLTVKRIVTFLLRCAVGGVLVWYYHFLYKEGYIALYSLVGGLLPPLYKATTMALISAGIALWILGSYLFKRFASLAKFVYAALLVVTPFLSFFLVEMFWHFDTMGVIDLYFMLINVGIYALIEIILVCALRVHMIGLFLCYVFTAIIGLTNYYLVVFRRQPFSLLDLRSAYTAAQVAMDYNYNLTDGSAMAVLIVLLILALIVALDSSGAVPRASGKRYAIVRGGAAMLSFLCLAQWMLNVDFIEDYDMTYDAWDVATTYRNCGFIPGVVASYQCSMIDEPEGYSAEVVESVFDSVLEEESDDSETINEVSVGIDVEDHAGVMAEVESSASDSSDMQPTIIAIMDEAFSDLSVLGELNCVQDDLDFYYSLAEDENTVEWGYSYVSTRGGGTCNTEFEFLTGSSMAFTGGNTPYQSFDFSCVTSLVSELSEQGYNAIAMHPEGSYNWRRSVVYPKLGFGEFLSWDDYEGKEQTARDRVSDAGDFEKLIEVYEEQEGPSFLFNVTMQNHGGYDENSLALLTEDQIATIDDAYAGDAPLTEYESLIAMTDDALEDLIAYFREVDEPVILCFFGDHQPEVGNEVDEQLLASGETEEDTELSLAEKKYAVPYFIWANYEIDADYSKQDTNGTTIMSQNYLSAVLLKYAGLEMSDFDTYRLAQREAIPAFNITGYLGDDLQWHELYEDNAYAAWVRNAELIQYNRLFDVKKNTERYSVAGN